MTEPSARKGLRVMTGFAALSCRNMGGRHDHVGTRKTRPRAVTCLAIARRTFENPIGMTRVALQGAVHTVERKARFEVIKAGRIVLRLCPTHEQKQHHAQYDSLQPLGYGLSRNGRDEEAEHGLISQAV